ncbi:hypothetical protein IVG45_21825 [Methylomonas sp. LL1]|uniref:hypothetical protein n=1 Tax=Methylomonas sp. LL1 TaxID=2785785 RepID=UPI0018C360A2|nr:hypothetical protein [Methylomonas sp. LL1]QPK63404.1 hypothetical protein IVG45_21825 [Methylomonas sp. LL1]
MVQTKPFDSNNSLLQIKCAIKDLRNFDGVDDEDDVIYAANRLNAVLRMIDDNHSSWNNDAIRDLVLSKHDPLKNITVKSDEFNHRVRKIQQDMIAQFS